MIDGLNSAVYSIGSSSTESIGSRLAELYLWPHYEAIGTIFNGLIFCF